MPSLHKDHFSATCSLADAAVGELFAVDAVLAPASTPEWAGQLQDIGFLAGEQVAVIARGLPGGDPLVVRVGMSTFALRVVEAACVKVCALKALPATKKVPA